MHLEHILEGVRDGVKAILCEKPIGVNAADVELAIQVVNKANVLMMVGLMYRHHPLTLAVKQHILDGAIGGIRFVRATFSTELTDRTNWRLRGDLGGGAVADMGRYCIDIIRYLIGTEPQYVWACGKFEPISTAWETLIGTLDFGDGITGQFDCSFGWDRRESYEVVGTKGTIVVPHAWSNANGECGFMLNGETENITGVNPYAAEILNLCESLATGNPPLLTMDDALQNMRVVDGVHEAAHTGKLIIISQRSDARTEQTVNGK